MKKKIIEGKKKETEVKKSKETKPITASKFTKKKKVKRNIT